MQLLTADSVNKRELEITKTEKTKRTKTCQWRDVCRGGETNTRKI